MQRPSVDIEFMGDIRLMTMAMRLVRRFELKSFYWTLEPMGEFVAWTHEELDYRREARYADRLRRNADRQRVRAGAGSVLGTDDSPRRWSSSS